MMRRARRATTLRTTAAVGALAMLLAACGGGDGDDGGDAGGGETTEEAGAGEDADDGGSASGEIDTDALEEVTITWPGGVGPEHWSSGGPQSWADEVEERSDGKITFDFHWGGSLGPLQEHSVMLRDGISDISEVYIAYEASTFPVANWYSSLAWYHDNRPVIGDLQAYGASVEWGFSEPARAEFEELGLMPLIPNIQALPTYGLICTEPVTSLDDAQGVSARVPGEVVGAEAEAVGFSPTQIPGPEAYESLQRGVIDCTVSHPRDLTAFGFADVAPHVTVGSEGGFSGFMGQGVYTTTEFWESLQPEARQILWESIPAYVEGQLRSALEEDAEALAEAESISGYDEGFTEALDEHQQAQLDGMVEEAPGAVEDPQAAVDEYDRIYSEWLEAVEGMGLEDWPDSWDEHAQRLQDEGVPDLEEWTQTFTERILEPNRPEM